MVINKTISAITLQAWQSSFMLEIKFSSGKNHNSCEGQEASILCSDLPHKLSRSNWAMMNLFPRAPSISESLSKCPLASLHLFSQWRLISYHAIPQLPVVHSVSLGIYSLSEQHLLKLEKPQKTSQVTSRKASLENCC